MKMPKVKKEAKDIVDILEEVDALLLENIELKLANLRLKLVELEKEQVKIHSQVAEKYKLSPNDQIEVESRKITRSVPQAPKPE